LVLAFVDLSTIYSSDAFAKTATRLEYRNGRVNKKQFPQQESYYFYSSKKSQCFFFFFSQEFFVLFAAKMAIVHRKKDVEKVLISLRKI
jgi:hypothetical protein